MRVASPGKYLAAVIPALDEFLLFKVKAVKRAGDGKIRYGAIPGAETIAPATIFPDPLNQWTLSAENVQGLQDLGGVKSDYIFYIPKDRVNTLFKYRMHIYPEVLKHTIFYPEQQVQSTFQNVSLSPIDDLGTFNGEIEVLQLPNCKVGFQTFNPLNATVYTNIEIEYVEYTVSLVRDRDEARSACFSGNVIPEILPIYNDSEFFRRQVIQRVYDGITYSTDLLESVLFREEKEKSEAFLLNLYGETDGTNTTGTFTLSSDTFDGTVEGIAIPKGAKAKIWRIEVDGEPCTVAVNAVRGIGTSSPTTTVLKTVTLSSPGTVTKEFITRPMVIDSSQSDTSPMGIAFAWQQVTAAKSTLSVDMEIVF